MFLPYNIHVSSVNNREIENKEAPKYSGVNSSSYSLEWEVTWGGPEAELGRGGIVIDDNGDIYITGSTYSYGSGGYDLFLSKYNGTGANRWSKIWGDSEHQFPHDIAISSSGNIYVTGEYEDIAGVPSSIFLAKFNSKGEEIWDNRWSASSWNEGFGVAVDESENIYVSGRSGNNFALVKYNSNGNLLWSKVVTSLQSGTDVALDTSGTIYTVGKEGGQAHLSKHNDVGDIIWTRFWGGSGHEFAEEMVIDGANNIYFTGRTTSYGAGSNDAYIAKYNSAGSMLWNKTWGTANYEGGYGITLDNETNIYLTGKTEISGKVKVFTAKFSSAGNFVWNDTWGGDNNDFGNGIALNNDGEIFVTGTTKSFGAGGSDIFLLKYNISTIQTNLPHPDPLSGIPGFKNFIVLASIGISVYIVLIKFKKNKRNIRE